MSCGQRLSIALIHYPVWNKNREVVATAVTNLDIHDIARSARTFGVARYYVVTPVVEQQKLVEKIRQHWIEGWGATYNPKRKLALELLQTENSLDDVLKEIEGRTGHRAKLVVTGAAGRADSVTFAGLKALLEEEADQHYLLLLGTGWGLSDEVFNRGDYLLEPIGGGSDYNHLSVRSAAAIMLDRLFGR